MTGVRNSAPSLGIALFPQYEPDRLVALARLVDQDTTFSHLWIPDERFFRDLTAELTLAAVNTERVFIGSAVTDPYIRHPALTAVALATVDEIAGGRVIAGMGAGISGFDALNITRHKPQLSVREAIGLMRALWKGGEVDLAGTTVEFHGRLDFAPARPDVPVWIAGRGPAILSLAGEIGDGVFIGGLASEPGLHYAHARIDAGVRKAGRSGHDVTRGLWLHTAVAEDGAAARAAVRTIVTGVLVSSRTVVSDLGIPLPDELMHSLEGVTYGVNSPQMRRLSAMVDDDVIRHFAVAGTPREVGGRIRELGGMGVDHIAVVPWLAEGQDFETFLRDLAAGVNWEQVRR